MNRIAARLRVYLELARLSNLPTTWGSIVVGAAIGAGGGAIDWLPVLLTALAISCLYVGGMALNDVVDAHIDAKERPQRPIPGGRITREAALIFSVGGLAVGLGILTGVSIAAAILGAALVVAIIGYNLLHKRAAGAVVLMGVCRGLIYPIGAAAGGDPAWFATVEPIAVAVAIYTNLLTLIAQREATPHLGWRKALSWFMAPIVFMAAIIIQPLHWWWSLPAAVVLLAWLGRAISHLYADPPRSISAIRMFLAGFALIDAFFLTLLDRANLALLPVFFFVLTIAAHRRIPGT